MTMKSILLGGALALGLSATSQAADLLNAGFETGDLAGWSTQDGPVEVVTDADDAIAAPPFGEHFTATEGGYFARLTAGPDSGVYTLLFQPFSISVASRISFDAAFLAFDYAPYDDDAYVRVYRLGAPEIFSEILFASSVSAVGDQGHTSWARYTSGELAAGDYVFEAAVRNIEDPDATYSSQLLVDNVAVSVPEPGAWAIIVLGFGATGAALRLRRRRALSVCL